MVLISWLITGAALAILDVRCFGNKDLLSSGVRPASGASRLFTKYTRVALYELDHDHA